MAKPIGTLGTVDTLTIGGRVFTDLTNLITLYAETNSANNTSTYRKVGSHVAAGYQVTAGKTLSIYAVRVISEGAGGSEVALAQSDNDVGLQGVTALGNPIYFGSESSTLALTAVAQSGTGVVGEAYGNPLGTVNSGKYLSSDSAGSTGALVLVYGYES